jgi:hypothetical protein
VCPDSPGFKPVFGKYLLAVFNIRRISGSLFQVKVISPRGNLHAIIAKRFDLGAHYFKGQICPLSRKNSNRSRHINSFLVQRMLHSQIKADQRSAADYYQHDSSLNNYDEN